MLAEKTKRLINIYAGSMNGKRKKTEILDEVTEMKKNRNSVRMNGKKTKTEKLAE